MTTASLSALPDPKSLGAALERQRLEHRAQRLRRVLAALDERRMHRSDADGGTPAPLREAIAGFRAELDGVQRRLSQLAD